MSDPTTSPPPTLHVRLLGVFCVSTSEGAVPRSAWRNRPASLVKLLALEPTHALHREEVVERLWPRSDLIAGLNNLHRTLYLARRTLPGEPGTYLVASDGSVRLRHARVDARAFLDASDRAERTHTLEDYEAARALYGGELLPEDCYEDWTVVTREEVEGRYLEVTFALAGLKQRAGDLGGAEALLQDVIARDATFEAACVALMRLYARSGRHQSAVLQYGRLKRCVRREFGGEPSEAARRLYETVLHDMVEHRNQ